MGPSLDFFLILSLLWVASSSPVDARIEVRETRKGVGRPDMPRKIQGVGRPDMPRQIQGVGRPDMPRQIQGVGRPDMPRQIQGVGRPDMSHQIQGVGRPDMSRQIQGVGRPDMPHQIQGVGRPDIPRQIQGVGRPNAPRLYAQQLNDLKQKQGKCTTEEYLEEAMPKSSLYHNGMKLNEAEKRLVRAFKEWHSAKAACVDGASFEKKEMAFADDFEPRPNVSAYNE